MIESLTELFEALTQLHRRYPQWRMGQLVANLAGWADQEIWDVEDQQLLEAARGHLDQLELRSSPCRSDIANLPT